MENSHLDPLEIEADIEKTRKLISENLEEIHDRLSPNRFLNHTIEYISDKMLENNTYSTSLTEKVKENPIPTALIGFGLGWLIISNKKNNKVSANAVCKHEDNNSIGAIDSELENNTDSTPDIPGRKKDSVEDNTKKNSQQGSDQIEHALNKLNEQPLVLVGAGLTLGVALGIYLTSSQRDNKTLKKNLGKQIDRAVETGDEQLEKVKEAVISAVETISQSAGEVSGTAESSEDKNKKLS